MSPDHWSKLTWDTVSAGGYDLFDPIGYLDRKRDRAYRQRVIDTPAVYPRFREPLHVDIQSTGQKSHRVNTAERRHVAMLCFN